MKSTRIRRAVAVLAAIAAVLGLSGCFKANQDMEIRRDGTGTVVLHLEVNKKAVAALSQALGDIGVPPTPMEEPFKAVDKTFPDGTKVRSVNGPDRSTADASFDFNSPDEYSRKMQEISQALSTDPGDGLPSDGSLSIRRVGDRMEVSLDLGSATAGADDIDLSQLQGVLSADALPSVVFAITMPGQIVATNGQQNGRTVSWDLLSKTPPDALTVTSKVEKKGLPAWAVPAGGGLLLLLLLALLAVLLTQRRRAAKPAGPPVAHQPGPWQPTPPGEAPGTFFPPPPGVAPRESVGWSQPPPPSGPVPPPSGPIPPPPSAGAPPPSGPGPVAWPPSPGGGRSSPGQPPREPAGWSSPTEASPGSPWAPRQPENPPPPPSAPAPDPEPRPGDPHPWRVPAAADPEPVAPDPEPQPEPEPTAAMQSTSSVEAGWYADPAGGSGARYWDGSQWTEHTR